METPFFELSKKEVFRRLEDLREITHKIYYSYKTNPVVGKILAEKGIALSLNHPRSLDGLDKEILERSIYYVQGETKHMLKEIHQKGISSFIVDNEAELKKILELGIARKIFLRVKFREHTYYTGKHFVFGISPQDIQKLVNQIKDKDISIALHFHRKTQNIGEWYIVDDFYNMFDDSVLNIIEEVNMGGGIPFYYVNSSPNLESIFKSIIQFKHALNKRGIALSLEPGRYIASPSIRLHTTIVNAYKNTLVVNASIYNAYMDTYLLHHRLPVKGEVENGYCYTIKGNTLDSLDIFRYKVCFSQTKNIGDSIVFLNAGAYNFHCAFSFLNPIPYVVRDDFLDD